MDGSRLVASLVIILTLGLNQIDGFSPSKIYPRRKTLITEDSVSNDYGEPLFLTPLIHDGNVDEARKLAQVSNLSEVVSYSGYFTVNSTHNSNMFFWFFPAAFNPENAPVLVWLQGGPGGSSLFGLFVENGPFRVTQMRNLEFRRTAWTLTHSVIYFDNPVGTGFSFTDDDEGYARTEEDVSRDLYNAITQFFTLFPNYADQDFYLTGESYAGKYIPAIAHKIHTEDKKEPKIRINMKGMAIGDGFSDPINMLNYGNYLYNVGLIDEKERQHFHREEKAVRDAIRKEDWTGAFETMDRLMDGDIMGTPYFTNVTGFTFYFNFMMPKAPPDHEYYSDFVQLPHVRRAIHVGNLSYAEDSKVERFLRQDMYKSVVPWIVDLLDSPEGYRILIYSGQLDIIVANINTEEMLRKMEWSGSKAYQVATKKAWKVGREIAGYVKTAKNLTYLLVRNAGHILPYDQPKWSFDMINRFTASKLFA